MSGGLEEEVKKIFMICPVRILTEEVDAFLKGYIMQLEEKGYKVHYPPRDTNQEDCTGLRICSDNRQAISDADEIHIYWNPLSEGSLFDFGMAFMLEKQIRLINRGKIEATPKKSFQNVLLELDARYNLP